jgi:hypothetical protein
LNACINAASYNDTTRFQCPDSRRKWRQTNSRHSGYRAAPKSIRQVALHYRIEQ